MQEEKVLLQATLCFPIKENKVLLSFKTRNIGQGCWNGYGGGIEKAETLKEAALRELKEEVGIIASPEDLDKVAIVDFHNTKNDGSIFICQVHVYLVSQWSGEPHSTDEMINPTWFGTGCLPTSKIMLADKEWLPIALSGKKIRATAKYGPLQKTLIGEVEIQEVDSLPNN